MTIALPAMPAASAASGDFSIDFVAASPESYNHLTGGGAYDNRTIGVDKDVVESLEGGDFACGDIITFFATVAVDNTQSAIDDGPQTIEMNFSFLADTTGQSGAAIGDIVNVKVNYGTIEDLIPGENDIDDGIIDDGGSVATLTDEYLTGPLFTAGSELHGTVELTDLDAGEQVVVRIDVKLFCQPGSNPTGNLQGALTDARLTFIQDSVPVEPPEAIPGGEQTIPFRQIGDLEAPELNIQKTVTTSDGTCPGVESLTVTTGDTVKYCYVVINTGSAPLYNLNVIDDAGTPSNPADDFTVTLSSGLTDIDGDGTADDLAAGGTATGTALVTLSTAGTAINTATATGDDSIIQPTTLTDNDTATVIVEFVPNPAYTIEKTVTDVAGQGPEGNVTGVGDVISYQINVTNDGNVDITNVTVTDPLLGTLTGPTGDDVDPGVLNVGETWTYTGTYTVTQEDINNNGNGDGFIDNTATVQSDQLQPETDSEKVPIEGAPAYTIEKTVTDVAGKGPEGNVTGVGDVISYQINVTNDGNVDITNVTVTDPLLGTLTGPTGDDVDTGVLNVGETWTYTGTYTVTQEDINNNGNGDGFIDNTATVQSDQLQPETDSEKVPIEEEQAPIEEEPAYTINKTVTDVGG
ncbi:DUF11 domain-containing protein [Methanosarcina sp. MTP4]|uniref:DUF7507 domain-containing protein n=1 Tax=Methanosarcina sp. MTP4 TaxID=1434100 RepID=UPI0006988B29|nr:DUF11 domain-containing protein [Methanosarcina sp. MTP4]